MKYLLSVIFCMNICSGLLAADIDTCDVLDLPNIYLRMSFEELSEQIDVSELNFYADLKKHQVIAYQFISYSDINRLDFIFDVEKWEDTAVVVVPNEAKLSYLMVSYNNDVPLEEKLFSEYAAPILQTIPEIGAIYNFDNQWNCISRKGYPVKITHIHKRVTYN